LALVIEYLFVFILVWSL